MGVYQVMQHGRSHDLIVVQDDGDLLAVWEVVQPQMAQLPSCPHIITADLVATWLMLNPAVQTVPVWGDGLVVPERDTDPAALHGRPLSQLLLASRALCTPDETADLAELTALYEIDLQLDTAAQFAHLHTQMKQFFATDIAIEKPFAPPRVLPDLVAIYDALTSAILVVAPSDEQWLQTTDWAAVHTWFKGQFDALLITTPEHLAHVANGDLAFDFAVHQYRHAWGDDFLVRYRPPLTQIIRRALAHVLDLYMQAVPSDYFGVDADHLRKAAHDLHNHLLRISLRYDVLSFDLDDIEIDPPPSLIEKTSSSQHERIYEIILHFRRWIAHYQAILQQLETA